VSWRGAWIRDDAVTPWEEIRKSKRTILQIQSVFRKPGRKEIEGKIAEPIAKE